MTIKPAPTLSTVAPTSTGEAEALSPQHPALSPVPVGAVDKIGDYKILGVLGSGGMGIVYKAFDQKLGRIVALKTLHVGAGAGWEELVRFRGEAETLGKLQHPHIVQVFDFGMHDDSPYLVLEFVNGGSLDKKLQGQPQYPRKAAEMIEQLARAMHAAHDMDIIHRDLKPANVMLTADGMPKITDFGLAKRLQTGAGLTVTGALMGTPSYMAPEQAAGKKEVGRESDVYSLGAILYEMLTGRPPFCGSTLQETLEQVQMNDPAPPSRLVPKVPRDLQTVCLKCLQKAPGRRYATAHDLADDLKNWLEGLPVKARPAHSLEWLIRVITRRPLRAALVAAGVLVVVLAVILGLVLRNAADRDAAREREKEHQEILAKIKDDTDKAKQAKDDADDSLRNLKEMLELTMAGDLYTDAGLNRLERKLTAEGGESPDKAMLLANAYHRLAVLRREQGEVDRGLELLDKAKTLAEFATGSKDDDFDAQMLRARIYQERGQLLWEVSPSQAVEDSDRAVKLLTELARLHPAAFQGERKPEYIRLRALALHHLGLAKWSLRAEGEARLRNMTAAEQAYREAEELLRELILQKNPDDKQNDDKRNLARALGRLGDLYLDWNRLPEADAVYWQSHLIRVELAKAAKPGDYEPTYQLGRSWENFGLYQTRQSSLETSLHFHRLSEQLRIELNRKQPNNREYTFDLIDARHRIAELELFAADPEPDAAKKVATAEGAKKVATADRLLYLAEAESRLRETHDQLTELVKILGVDTRAAIPAHSRLGECCALQARAWMIRLSLTPQDGAALEKAAEAAREANKAYEKVTHLRAGGVQAPSSDEPGQGPTLDEKELKYLRQDELYHRAAMHCLTLETYLKKQGGKDTDVKTFYAKAKVKLDESIKLGFRRLTPREITRDRAFRSAVERDWFKALLGQQAPTPAAPAAPPRDEPPAGNKPGGPAPTGSGNG